MMGLRSRQGNLRLVFRLFSLMPGLGLRPRQGNLRLVFRLFKFYARQASHKTK